MLMQTFAMSTSLPLLMGSCSPCKAEADGKAISLDLIRGSPVIIIITARGEHGYQYHI